MPVNGVMVVDKPAGWTSHDVVARMRRIVGERSIGHLGTLDPMATGVLPLVLGRMTRLCQFYTASEKTYEGTIRLGVATDTYDCDGDPVGVPQEVNVTLEEVRSAASVFCGHDSARLRRRSRPRRSRAFRPTSWPAGSRRSSFSRSRSRSRSLPSAAWTASLVEFRCRVSSGTYVRSLAHELGQKLGIGAHLASLRRTAVAEFTLEQSHTLEAGRRSRQPGPNRRAAGSSAPGPAGDSVALRPTTKPSARSATAAP